jgi:hypothetical protein
MSLRASWASRIAVSEVNSREIPPGTIAWGNNPPELRIKVPASRKLRRQLRFAVPEEMSI